MSFEDVILDIRKKFVRAPIVHNATWQSVKSPQDTYELLNYSFQLDLHSRIPSDYHGDIKPNLPWADRHFENERVSGLPINPGKEWRIWPYAASADTHRRTGEEDPQFDHSYAERYWPKYAGTTAGGQWAPFPEKLHAGIRFMYGDLLDLVNLLARDPTTRQAYLPVWFPEDLQAAILNKRVPCSLGYHFIVRENRIHVNYYMRSCDFVRHFRDDVYLTLRLLLWVLDKSGIDAETGTMTMHITSLHCFISDYKRIIKGI